MKIRIIAEILSVPHVLTCRESKRSQGKLQIKLAKKFDIGGKMSGNAEGGGDAEGDDPPRPG